jgi:hypothetical protein
MIATYGETKNAVFASPERLRDADIAAAQP